MAARDHIAQPPAQHGGYSRRRFLQAGGVALAGLAGGALAGCSSSNNSGASASSGSKTLVYAGFGGTYQTKLEEAVLEPFQKATGITVVATTGADEPALLKAMVQAGKTTWDIMDLYTATLGTNEAGGLLQKIDYSKIDVPKLTHPAVAATYGVGYYLYSHNIWRNTSIIKEPLNSWAEVFDIAAFPGKRGFLNTPDYSPEEAMLANGRSLDSVYPIDIDLYLSTLSKIRSSAVFLDTDPLTDQITQGDIATGDLNQTRLETAIQAGAPLEYNWQQTIVDVNYFGIPVGAPHADAAYKLINFALQTQTQLSIPKVFGSYSPVAVPAFDTLSSAQLANLAGSPVNAPNSVFLQPSWYVQNGAELDQRFSAWLTS